MKDSDAHLILKAKTKPSPKPNRQDENPSINGERVKTWLELSLFRNLDGLLALHRKADAKWFRIDTTWTSTIVLENVEMPDNGGSVTCEHHLTFNGALVEGHAIINGMKVARGGISVEVLSIYSNIIKGKNKKSNKK